MDSLKFVIHDHYMIDMYYISICIILIYSWFLFEKSYVIWKYLQFFSFGTFNRNLKTWLKVYINNVGYETIYTYNIIYVWLWMSRFEVEKSFPVALKEARRRTYEALGEQTDMPSESIFARYTMVHCSECIPRHTHTCT